MIPEVPDSGETMTAWARGGSSQVSIATATFATLPPPPEPLYACRMENPIDTKPHRARTQAQVPTAAARLLTNRHQP
jgi:hypothetical protein